MLTQRSGSTEIQGVRLPELPEVETVVEGLRRVLPGRRFARVVARRPDLRVALPAGFVRRLKGRRVVAVDRRAKYILVALDDGTVLLIHLGMSGRLLFDAAEVGPHDHVTFGLDDGRSVTFRDPRRFGMMDLADAATLADHPRLKGLGPEPLAAGFTGTVLADRLAGRRTPIKAALLDQGTVAGLGNIYVCETLYHARLSPVVEAAAVTPAGARRLVRAVRKVLRAAIAAGGSSLRDYVQVSGELGYFQTRFAVYGRAGAPCPDCVCDVAKTGGIARMVQANRSTFYCAWHQRCGSS